MFLFFGAAIVNNFVLVRFLGLCPFLGVSNKISAAFGMGIATTFVLLVTSMGCYAVNTFVLIPYNLQSLDLIMDIVVIALTVQLVEIAIRFISYDLYNALGIYLPLITTNCVVLGLVLLQNSLQFSFSEATAFALGAGSGFTLVLTLFAAIRERLAISDVPEPFKNTAIALITAGLLSLAFMGFAGFAGSAA
ncbi:Rnf-Nqr domain containing protein [uncultured Succinivibrio sp.]|uniref:electron transport complex protein RnfA n=1 Tax=uncultured Succinivibrio sp. TaxID=540749 RepID=UPI003444AE45